MALDAGRREGAGTLPDPGGGGLQDPAPGEAGGGQRRQTPAGLRADLCCQGSQRALDVGPRSPSMPPAWPPSYSLGVMATPPRPRPPPCIF